MFHSLQDGYTQLTWPTEQTICKVMKKLVNKSIRDRVSRVHNHDVRAAETIAAVTNSLAEELKLSSRILHKNLQLHLSGCMRTEAQRACSATTWW